MLSTPHTLRLTLLLALLGGVVLGVGMLLPSVQPMVQAVEATAAQAGLVVRFDDGTTRNVCVNLGPTGEMSGEELLRASGLAVTTLFEPSQGSLVCSIEGAGCPISDCLCQCRDLNASCRYWAYFRLEQGSWLYSSIGLNRSVVRHGMVEGWSWGAGTVGEGTQPPLLAFADICVPPPTVTPLPSATVLAATATALPPTALPPTATGAANEQPAPAQRPNVIPLPSSTPPLLATRAPLPTATTTPPPSATTTPPPSATTTPPPSATATPPPSSNIAPTTDATVAQVALVPSAIPTIAPPVAPPPPSLPTEPTLTATAAVAGGLLEAETMHRLWLPLVLQVDPAAAQAELPAPTETPAPTATPSPTETPSPTAVPTPTAVPSPPDSAPTTGRRELGWFVTFSTTLALALVWVRVRRR